MVGIGGVPRRAGNGSGPDFLRILRWIAAAVGVGGCLNGEARPIVATGATDGGGQTADSAPALSACPPGAALTLYYRAGQAAASSDSIDFLFKVANNTGASIPLSSLSARYYFTNEITPTWQTSVYYAGECCGASRSGFTSDVTVGVAALATPTANADHYVEVSFDSGAGDLIDGDAVQIEVGFFAPMHDQTLDQTNDYSFLASAAGTQAEWDQCPTQCGPFQSCVMTLFSNGSLVWGTPP